MQRMLFLAFAISVMASSGAFAQAPFRADCRYHVNDADERVTGNEHHGPRFCYASIEYEVNGGVSNVFYGVGCDNQTLYDDTGRFDAESTLDRVSPPTAAYPAIEIQPSGAMSITGTYTSVLDSGFGRFVGTCYVHALPILGR